MSLSLHALIPSQRGLKTRSLVFGGFGVVVAVLLFAAITASSSHADTNLQRKSTVQFQLLDDESGEGVTAMFCIECLDDDTVRIPPSGKALERVGRVDEFYKGIEYDSTDPDWIGPIRKSMGIGDNNDRSYVYEERPSVPFWTAPVMYQMNSRFTVDLEPGSYRITVARGMEHIPVEHEFEVGPNSDLEQTVRLKRWIDLPSKGWYSGDVHVHHPLLTDGHRDFLLHYARAEDLHVVNVLEMGHHRGTDFKQRGFGKSFRERKGDYVLVAGQEEPRSTFGHIIGLNTTQLARDVSTYDLYDLAFQRLHEQEGAVVGFAHFSWNGCNLPRGFPWYVTTEGIDFVELLQFNTINCLDYYDYLNLGFRLSAAAGSDIPWGSTLGECRTYVHTGDELDIDAWFEGLRKGRTFVSNGPAIDFTVNEQLAGSVIDLEAPDTVTVVARADGHPRVGMPQILELIGNEGVIHRVERSAASGDTLEIEQRVEVTRSQWLVASTRCENGAVAHSSPIYVTVNGEPTWSPKQAPEVIKKQLAAIANIEAEFDGKNDQRSRSIRERLDRARRYYGKLMTAIEGAKDRE